MGVSYAGIAAQYTTVIGLRRGDLLDDEPVEQHTIILDGLDEVVLIDGSLEELAGVASGMNRALDTIRAGLDTAQTTQAGPAAEENASTGPFVLGLPPTLDYIAIDPDGSLRLVSAVLNGGTLDILHAAVGGRIQFIPGNDKAGIDCYANEEGALWGLPLNQIAGLVHSRLTGFGGPLVLPGTIVFVGTDGEGAASLTPAQRQRVLDVWAAATGDPS